MKNKLTCACLMSLIFILVTSSQRASAQATFDFTGGFSYSLNISEDSVFDLTPDSRIAVILTSADSPPGASRLTAIDPVTGFIFDTKTSAVGPIGLKIVALNDGLRVVLLTNLQGVISATIFDLSQNGLLTQRTSTVVYSNPGISVSTSNLMLSPLSRTGYVTTEAGPTQVISFSLDTGAVLDTLNARIYQRLNMYEDANRRILVGGFVDQLVFLNATDPADLQLLGTTTLPSTGAFFGTLFISTVFSNNGQHVFAGSGFAKVSAVDTVTRQVVGSLASSNYRANKLKIFESGGQRMLGLRSLEDGAGVLKGYALIDANNPTNLSVINEVSYGEDIFSGRDFCFSQNGRRFFVSQNDSLTAFAIPDFRLIWNTPLPAQQSVKVVSFGQPERIMGAWYGAPFTSAGRIFSMPNRTNRLANFDLDGKTDISVFRPGTGIWYWTPSISNVLNAVQFGQPGDVPVAADYDGDEKTDLAVFRPADSTWYIFESSTNSVRTVQFGVTSDEPVQADYDGDGKADLAVFRRTPHRWFVLQSSNGLVLTQEFGSGRGYPVIGDYDGDAKADFAFFDALGSWHILNSSNGTASSEQFGAKGDVPVSGDFDNDGRTDLAVFRQSASTWYIRQSFFGLRAVAFGVNTDKLVPADYDGDGRTDVAVFRPSNGTWYILQSSNNVTRIVNFGAATDIPVTSQPLLR
jgi:hypothetical protein